MSTTPTFGGSVRLQQLRAFERLNPPPPGMTAGQRRARVPGLAGSGLGGGGGGTGGKATSDLRRTAARLMPWWPSQLLDIYVKHWIDTDDPELALANVRASSAYKTHFPGNIRSDGTVRWSEQAYNTQIEGFALNLRYYGLNPAAFKPRFGQLIEHGVQPHMLAQRLQAVHSEIWQNTENVRQVYAQYYGRGDLTREAVFAMAIDPKISEDVISRRITAAQIGGAAAQFGFDRTVNRAQELAKLGLDQSGARSLYAAAQHAVPMFQTLAQRHSGRGVDIREFEAAFLLEDPDVQQRMRRLQRREQAMFTPAGGFARDQQGQMAGLRQR